MATRTLSIVAGLGMLVGTAAHADQPSGDIVDQILLTMPPAPGAAVPPPAPMPPPPPPPAAMPPTAALVSPASPPPAPAPAPPSAPVSLAPASPAPSSTAAAAPLLPGSPSAPVPAHPAPASPSPAPAASPMAVAPAPQPLPVLPVSPPTNGDIVSGTQPLPPPPPIGSSPAPWTGFYFGGNFGYGFTNGGSDLTCLNSVTGTNSGCDIINSPALHSSGVLGGGQVGYLMPLSGLNLGFGTATSPLMVGVEADFQGTGIHAKQSVPGPFNLVGFPPAVVCTPCSFSASQGMNWISTVRARVGVPLDNVFIYGTGGVAVGSVTATQNLNFTGTSQGDLVTAGKDKVGPTVGGGIEVQLGGPFSLKFEGLYYDLGKLSTAATAVNGAPTNFTNFKSFGFQGGVIRVGINIRLGGLGGT